MNTPDYLISTPENVDLHLELAGLGNRILASFVDHIFLGMCSFLLIMIAVGVGVAIDTTSMGTEDKTVIYFYLAGATLLALFVINFGYFVFFEGVWRGQTPGKKLFGIRVIEHNGQPIGWGSAIIRNLLRIIDELPLLYVGILPMLIDKNERRFGDFAAGTLVIRERLQSFSTTELRLSSESQVNLSIDTGQITPADYALIVSFLKRRELMARTDRQRLSSNMAAHFKQKLQLEDNGDSPELLVEKLFNAYNSRAEEIS